MVGDIIKVKDITDSRNIWDLLRLSEKTKKKEKRTQPFAIIGAPGCGKTTLMQNVAITITKNLHRRHKVRSYVPILLFLREHSDNICKDETITLATLVENHFGDKKRFPTLKPPQGWFTGKMESGRCLVLLDGFDEVGDKEIRLKVSKWVDRQIGIYQNCTFFLTSRPQGYKDAPLTNVNVMEVQNFNVAQVKTFIENWYIANEFRSAGNEMNATVRERAKDGTIDLLKRLGTVPALLALTANPLLLTMIAMVHRYHGALPGSRSELYKEMCEVMLGRWRQTAGVQDEYKAGQKRSVLEPLACHMMEHGLREIPRKEAITLLDDSLRRVGVKAGEEDAFFIKLQETSGIVIEREAGLLSFAHLTFQEYLTASCWKNTNLQPSWNKLVNDSWWHETIRLYVAQGDATGIIEACLENNTFSSLTLALECAEEAEQIDADIRERLNDTIDNDIESDNGERQRLSAEVSLNNRLKKFKPIDGAREICEELVTCSDYRLFIEDMINNNIPFKPEHWLENNFPHGTASMPVSGINFFHAEEFCKWLTKKQGGTTTYRLPLLNETTVIKNVRRNSVTRCWWIGDEDWHSTFGLSDDKINQIKGALQRESKLFNSVYIDINADVVNQHILNKNKVFFPNLLRYENLILFCRVNDTLNTKRDLDLLALARDHARDLSLAHYMTLTLPITVPLPLLIKTIFLICRECRI
ncbi:MAG: NACHT domain-containing protein [Nitrospirae bacterium]|nr:NACHT domain-containing protein [Nitrospirota bacterium]